MILQHGKKDSIPNAKDYFRDFFTIKDHFLLKKEKFV